MSGVGLLYCATVTNIEHLPQVLLAEAQDLTDLSGEPVATVAVKRVKGSSGPQEKADLARETRLMRLLGRHPNVVALLGCCTEAGECVDNVVIGLNKMA